MRRWREKYPNTLVLDAGNLADSPRRGRVAWQSLVEAGYDAVSYGPADAAWAGPYWEMVTQDPIPVIALRGFSIADGAMAAQAVVRRDCRVKSVGGVTVGIAGTGPGEQLSPEEEQHLAGTLRRLRAECDVVILFSHRWITAEREAQRKELAGLVDLVVGTPGSESLAAPERIGTAAILPSALQGRQVGVARVWVVKGAQRRIEVQAGHIPITQDTPTNARVADMIADFFASEQERTLRQLSADAATLAKRGYLRPEACAPCHAAQERAWKASRHAHALGSLVEQKVLQAECLPCHSQAYRETARLAAGDAPQGVECGSCHEGAAAHLKRPERGTIRRGTLKECSTCHTPERSPGFKPAEAWGRIRH